VRGVLEALQKINRLIEKLSISRKRPSMPHEKYAKKIPASATTRKVARVILLGEPSPLATPSRRGIEWGGCLQRKRPKKTWDALRQERVESPKKPEICIRYLQEPKLRKTGRI